MARGAEEIARQAPRRTSVATGWAYEFLRPAEALQEAFAGLLVGEEPAEIGQILRVIHTRQEAGCVSKGHATIYSSRWHEGNTPFDTKSYESYGCVNSSNPTAVFRIIETLL